MLEGEKIIETEKQSSAAKQGQQGEQKDANTGVYRIKWLWLMAMW